ncbi:MAG: hypothetical protein NT039_03105 [Candidatus Berkelbacteria bacterium]|nr:hypothetical protein [Candidatus Berkelbacteria bacterium]
MRKPNALVVLLWIAIRLCYTPVAILAKYLGYLKRRRSIAEDGGVVILFVAAQHPLEDGVRVGEAFRNRLIEAIRWYLRLREQGKAVKVTVCGPRYYPDSIPLYQAAKEFLLAERLPETDLIVIRDEGSNCLDEIRFARDLCQRMTPESGKPPKLIIIEACYKRWRNYIGCLWMMGLVPEFILIPEDVSRKEKAIEAVLAVYTTLIDPDWQSPYSPLRWLSWRTRRVPQ